jgi:phosphopantetheinyl transferase
MFTRTVDVLTADLTTVKIDESILSVGELGRALEYSMTSELRPYLAARTWLRQRLGEYLDCTVDEIELDGDGQLRITAPDTDLTFDLSYADGIVALAVGFRMAVGVSVAAVGGEQLDTEMARRMLTRPEANTVFSSPDMRREFSKLWSRKQALARALGQDPEEEPKKLSVLGLSPVKWDGFEVVDVNLGDGVAAAVAVPQGCSLAVTALLDLEQKPAAQVAVAV